MPIKTKTPIKISSLLITFTLAACGGKILTVENPDGGTVSSEDGFIDCGTSCEHEYTSGTAVNVSAEADENFVFMNWEGACVGAASSCELSMVQNKQVAAVFNSYDEPGIGAAPAVLAGSTIDVNYVTADSSTLLGLYEDQAASSNDHASYRYLYHQVGSTQFRVPTTPGTYEWRIYPVGEDTPIFEGKQFIVLPYEAFMSFAQETVAGSTIELNYSGSTSTADRVGVFELDTDNQSPISYTYLSSDSGTINLRLPTIEGEYDVRMFNVERETIIADSITILPYDADMSFSPEAVAGSRIAINYSGSTSTADRIGVFEAASDNLNPIMVTYLSSDSGTVNVLLPTVPEYYEVRMFNANKESIIVEPITVLPYDAQISVPQEGAVDSFVEIGYSGSTSTLDRIGIFEIDADNNSPIYLTYLSEDSGTVNLRLPSEPGDYEVRMLNYNRETIAHDGINVTL